MHGLTDFILYSSIKHSAFYGPIPGQHRSKVQRVDPKQAPIPLICKLAIRIFGSCDIVTDPYKPPSGVCGVLIFCCIDRLSPDTEMKKAAKRDCWYLPQNPKKNKFKDHISYINLCYCYILKNHSIASTTVPLIEIYIFILLIS